MANKYVFLFLLLVYCSNIYAQCSIESYQSNNGTSLVRQAKPEIFLKDVGDNNNGDYTRGFVQIFGRLVTIQNAKSRAWQLQIMVSNSANALPIVPREIEIYFSDNTSLKLKAASYEERKGVRSCMFMISEQQRNQLRNPIKEIEVTDTRMDEDNTYVCTSEFGLYERVLSEQADCLD